MSFYFFTLKFNEPMPHSNIKNPVFGYCENNTCSICPVKTYEKIGKAFVYVSQIAAPNYLYNVAWHCTGAHAKTEICF